YSLLTNTGVDNNEWGMYINHNFAGDGSPSNPPLDHCVTQQATQFWIDDLGVGTQPMRTGATPVQPPTTPKTPTLLQLTPVQWFLRAWAALASTWRLA